MDKLLPALGIIAVVLVVLALALAGWRRRVRRDALAGGGYSVPATAQAAVAVAAAEVLYVATTRSGEHLERLVLPGLAYRGTGTIEVSTDGVRLAVVGEEPVYIPSGAITGTGTATVAIDRAVERDGLFRLGWTTSGGVAADSYFRVVDPADRSPLTAAIEQCENSNPKKGKV